MTISQVIKQSALPQMEVEILLAFLLNKNREFILAHPELIVSAAINKKFRTDEKKRLNNWPLAYLTGHKEFYGLDFMVSPAVLVPRPETEMMVEEILNEIKTERTNGDSFSLVDVGTGSGAIIITLSSELRCLRPAAFKKSRLLATDISATALKIARINVKQHGLEKKIKFSRGNLLAPIETQLKNNRLIIAANLPYLTSTQIKNSPSIKREPHLALNGGADGLKYYRRLFAQLSKIKFPAAAIYCEIDPGQTAKLRSLIKKHWSGASVKIQPDLAGKNRLAIIKIENG